MRFLISLIISLTFLLPMKVWGFGNYREHLNDLKMQNTSIQYLTLIVHEMDFLVDTKPVSWRAFWEDLRGFRYIPDDEENVPKSLEKFYSDGGGDCDEFTLYITARLLQFKTFCGFMSIHSDIGSDHIVSLYKVAENDYFVVDVPLSRKMDRHSLVFAPSKYIKILAADSTNSFVAYRPWWFLERVENQPPIRIIR